MMFYFGGVMESLVNDQKWLAVCCLYLLTVDQDRKGNRLMVTVIN